MAESNVTSRICSVDGCERILHAGGLCSMHYARHVRHGHTEKTGTAQWEADDWLKAAVLETSDECLIWPFSRNNRGYGQSWDGSRLWLAHRRVFEMASKTEIPDKMVVRHLCGNGHLGCVNPRHLAVGTQKENCDDTLAQGRRPRGSKCSHAKLAEDDVRAIRSLVSEGVHSDSEVARLYRVSRESIRDIRNRKRWGWLE